MSFPFLSFYLLTFFSLFLLSFTISFPSSIYNSIYELSSLSNEATFFGNISHSISSIINKSLSNIESEPTRNMTPSCVNQIRNTFLNENNPKANEFYIHKLLQDSSTNKNEVSAFQRCMRKTYNYNLNSINAPIRDFYFVVLEIDATKNIESCSSTMNEHWYSLAFCLPKMEECNENDFESFFYTTTKILKDLISLTDGDEIRAFTIDLNEKEFRFHWEDVLKSLPLVFILCQIIICLFNIFPFCLVKSCCKRKGNDYNNSELLFDDNADLKYNKTYYKQIKSCFNKTQNTEELFTKNYSTSEINNYSGITYTMGLRGINMILFLFGNVFFELFNSYVTNYTEESFITVMLNRSYVIFYIGMKYAPRILLSISGFVLYYKMMCFIDDKVEEKFLSKKEEEMKNTKHIRKRGRKGTKGRSTSPEISINLNERTQEDIPFKIYFTFIAYQLHRYFMFILLALFLRLTMYNLVVFLKGDTPFWKMVCRSWISDISITKFLFSLTTLRSFVIKDTDYDFFSFYWILSNEIFLFIIGSLIIFMAYKHKLRVDLFLMIGMFIIFACKLFYYFTVSLENQEHASLYFYFWGYGKFMLTPFYNVIYFLIGMFFGSLNYVLQKGITYDEVEKQGKPFLYFPVRYVNFFQSASVVCIYTISTFGLLFIVLLSFMYYIIVNYLECTSIETCFSEQMQLHMVPYLKGAFLNFIYLIDNEVVLFFVHWIGFALYVKGNNFLNDFLSFRIWASLDKCYFSYLIALHLVTNYVLAQSDTRISFNLENVVLYSIIIGFWLFIVTIISYIFFELPYKRLIKVISKKKEVEKEISNTNNTSFSEHILISPDMNFDTDDNNDESKDQGQNSQLLLGSKL